MNRNFYTWTSHTVADANVTRFALACISITSRAWMYLKLSAAVIVVLIEHARKCAEWLYEGVSRGIVSAESRGQRCTYSTQGVRQQRDQLTLFIRATTR